MTRIGFMQGRLSPLVDGKIQAFPWSQWREEFATARSHGFPLMEWTLDHDRLYENPVMTVKGRQEIASLSRESGVRVESLTGDCFMQAPFYKVEGAQRQQWFTDFRNVIDACLEAGIKWIVVPLVDNGRLEDARQVDRLKEGLAVAAPALSDHKAQIVFESDFPPERLKQFIDGLPADSFGINYDIGNSASLGFEPHEEIRAYGARIGNVHVKDRKLGGTTVPLGTGNADLPRVFRLLLDAGYAGNYILQTARASDGQHATALCSYRDMVKDWLHA
jgi:hexulose-6-phosphate isomerase